MELLGVIGNPISHSLSPVMHEAALRATGKAGIYLPLLVEEKRLAQAIYGAQALGFTGLNVTVPFKEKVIPYLTSLTPEAQRIQSVNTISFQGDQIIGHSTDGPGFMRAVESELAIDFTGKTILVIGAGGAARAIVAELSKFPCRLVLVNRTLERATKLAHDLSGSSLAEFTVLPLIESVIKPVMGDVDVIINTTSVGMAATHTQTPISPALLNLRHIVIDIIYNPQESQLLKVAKQRGCRVQNGVGMLVYQAVLAWDFWWGQTPPVDVMFEAIKASLPV